MICGNGHPDPTAGVTLFRIVECPRCGIEKGTKRGARPGVCHDCHAVMTTAERAAWKAAA